MITFLVVLTAALAVLAVTRARRRREVLVYAWLMPASTVVQAVIGGITVLTGLLWWTVAIHLLASMTMVWLSVLLYVKIGEPDGGVVRHRGAETVAPVDRSERDRAGRRARHRHAGDRRRPARRRQEHRPDRCRGCRSRSPRWCTCTRRCWWRTCRCSSASGFALLAVRAPRPVMLRLGRAAWRWCALRDWSAPCSSSPVCPRRWWPSTSPVRPPAPRPPPRYGRRCESGPRPEPLEG